ncbi:hypothetical protein BWQ96_10302 [Gracilariopsis chorda]|uniref:YkuD domain-containing protein n=1 Tax=Gracilariopsis chorda TaxID=448386 RepID=A0A2V3ID41_9FLOR|nr:hypothetical protein BWQ96_10302 [Gracilariopsis chorda]|eukprot:PXF39987.1 hypothetical protein BWQ96_10302 [Gracilariopsis chorda]
MKLLLKLIALTVSLSVAYATSFGMPDWCQLAYDDCKLKFEGHDNVPSFSLDGPADESFTPQIVSRNPGERIGVVTSNGIPPQFILSGYNVRPFNFYYRVPSLTLFKPYTLPHRIGSGIGHEHFDGNFARGSCIRVYITNYQLLVAENPPSVRNINLNRREALDQGKCVVFRTRH